MTLFSITGSRIFLTLVIFLASPFMLLMLSPVSTDLVDAFTQNKILFLASCFLPYLVWPYFWRSLAAFKFQSACSVIGFASFIFGVLSYIVWPTVPLIFTFMVMIAISFFLSSVLYPRVAHQKARREDFALPFYFYSFLLIFIQLFPAVFNYLGFPKSVLFVQVNYGNNGSVWLFAFMALLFSTIYLNERFSDKLKTQTLSFSLMNVLTLTFMGYQVIKHSALFLN